MVFDDNGEEKRFTATPHLVIEILSSDPARDINRKAAKYAAAGVERYWIIDPDEPDIIVHKLSDGVPVVALCGKKWIPNRDPDRYPVCPTCQEIKARRFRS